MSEKGRHPKILVQNGGGGPVVYLSSIKWRKFDM